MYNKLLVVDKKTKSTYIKNVDCVIPKYELGDKVGVLANPSDPSLGYLEYLVCGVYTEYVFAKDKKTKLVVVNYLLDNGETILEEEVEYKC